MIARLHPFFLGCLCLTLSLFNACQAEEEKPKDASKAKKPTSKVVSLFDGKTLKGWKKIDFGGTGEVEVDEGELILYMGEIMTGIKIDGEPPFKSNYEISLDAKRIDGSDFFCALTFPIRDTNCTFVVGGWGGSLVGISSIDNMDASENSTGSVHLLEDKVWHHLRLRVTDTILQAWIGEKQVVNMVHTDHKLGMRFGEIEECLPLGIASFQTKAAFKNIKIKPVDPKAE
jgi:hypothetical protein